MFKRLLNKQYLRFLERNWDTLYFIVDVHEVILKPDYEKSASEYYPLAKEVLQKLSNLPEVCLIMWTASVEEDRKKYLDKFKNDGIIFKYCNENPEVAKAANWGDYETKMYANVGLDDKFGFNADIHWKEIQDFYETEYPVYKNIDDTFNSYPTCIRCGSSGSLVLHDEEEWVCHNTHPLL